MKISGWTKTGEMSWKSTIRHIKVIHYDFSMDASHPWIVVEKNIESGTERIIYRSGATKEEATKFAISFMKSRTM